MLQGQMDKDAATFALTMVDVDALDDKAKLPPSDQKYLKEKKLCKS